MLQHVIHMKSRIFKEVQKRNKQTTVLLKEATIDYAKLMQLTIFCKQQGIPKEFFDPASQRFMEYWARFFPNFILHELYYEFSEAGDFALTVNFQRSQRRVKGETNDLKDKAAELFAVCLREIDISKANHLDEELTARQKQIDELELEYKTYREISEQDLQEKDQYLDRLQAKYKQMDKNLLARQERINDLEKDHEHFRQHAARNIQAKSNQLDVLQGRYEQLNEELAARQQRINNIGRDHEIFRKQAELDVESKNEQLEVLQDRYEKLEDELSFYEEKIKTLEKEHHVYRDRTEGDIERKNGEVKDLQEKLTEKQRILDDSIPNFERYKKQSEEKLAIKNKELAELELKHEEITSELVRRQQKVSQLEANLEAFKNLAESELSKKNEELALLQKKYGEMTTQLNERQEQISHIEQEQKVFTERTEQDIQEKDEQLGGLREKFDKITEDLSQQNQIVELEADHEAFRKQVRQDILAKKEQLDDLHDKYDQMDQELATRQAKIDSLEVDYASFREQVEQDIQAKNQQLDKLQTMYDDIKQGKQLAETSGDERPVTKMAAVPEVVKVASEEEAVPVVEAREPTEPEATPKAVVAKPAKPVPEPEAVSQKEVVAEKTAPVKGPVELAKEAAKMAAIQKPAEVVPEAKKKLSEEPVEEPEAIEEEPEVYNMPPAVEITQEFREIKRFADVHMDADFRHLGDQDKQQPKTSPKIENMRERLKASVGEQGASVAQPTQAILKKPVVLPSTGKVAAPVGQNGVLEGEIRELFKQSQRPDHDKRVKVQKDDYYSYTTAIDFLDYQWSQAMLHKQGTQGNEFFNWVQTYIDHLPNFKDDLEINVRKPMFNKTSYLTNSETLNMLKGYALLNQYLELYCEEVER